MRANLLAGPPVRNTLPGHGPGMRQPGKTQPPPLRAMATDTDSTDSMERTGTFSEPRVSRAPSGAPPAEPDLSPEVPPPAPPEVPPEALMTMRNLPPLPTSARVRAASVAPRDLPSLDPFLPAMPATADAGADPGASTDDLLATTARRRRPSFEPTPFGSAIIARRASRGRWALLLALLLAGGAAAAIAIYASGRTEPAPEPAVSPAPEATKPPPPRSAGTVKFVTVPEDAEITVEGHPPHAGSPWAIELPAGAHQITIQRSGYKAWLTSLELSASETQLLRVVLEPLGGTAAAAGATLILSTTPPGLEVVLDGRLLQQRTPLRMPIRPGRHVIAVRQDGADVWRHVLDAKASADYEFTPSMTEAKQRERAERSSSAQDPADDGPPTIVEVDRGAPATGTAGEARPPVERTIDSPSLPSISAITPVIVPPTAVTRVGGATPVLSLPPRAGSAAAATAVAAKVCIDTAGRVTTVDVLTKLEPAAASELSRAIHGWTYRPYQQGGAAVPACFAVSFRVK
jgi:hypothetical protein